ncbi:MAG TPA: oligopeptide/dipeptide ABC transporter ATP-binding protein, partial [Ktedonobacterales bacterium]|nr:oligopeptide/dipeptide ABC transporter ATP-binding protein [Ktedonobacterales bacterium]
APCRGRGKPAIRCCRTMLSGRHAPLISAAPNPNRPIDAPFQAYGEIPSLIKPPTGCRFHPRCPHAMPVCRERFPGRTELGGGHWTHCFLYGEGTSADAATATTSPATTSGSTAEP